MRIPAILIVALAVGVCTGSSAAPARAQDGQRLALEAGKAHLQGKLDQALAQFTEALGDSRLSNDRRALILNDRGALLARLNQPKAALDDFNRAVQLYPEYAGIYNNRGSTLLTIGLAGEAIKDFNRAVLLAPGYVAAYNNRAHAHLLLKQHAQAIHDFTRAIELSPGTLAALSGRGQAQLATDRPQAALRDFSAVLAIDGRLALGYRNRAKARLLAEQYSEAVEDLSRAVAFTPADPTIYLERGEAYMAALDIAAAIKDFGLALETAPRHLPALVARAFAHVRIDAYTEAEADIQRALAIDERSGGAVAARALLYLRTGQAALALREIERASKLAAADPEVLWAKGEIAEATGKRDQAIASYRSALAVRPELKQATLALERLGAGPGAVPRAQLADLGFGAWRVTQRGRRFAAVNDELPRLSIPLEATGEDPPRLLAWDVKQPPYDKIGLLRYASGRIAGPQGALETEHVALVDLGESKLLGVVPERRGTKKAAWTWATDKVAIVGVDGLTDEFALNVAKPRPSAAAIASAQRRRRNDMDSFAPPGWIPWEANAPPRRTRATSQRRRQPKTLFDMIFGN